MTSRYSKVQSSIWDSDKFNQLKEFEKLVFFYLLTSPHGNSLGFYKLKTGYATLDLGCTEKRFIEAISSLVSLKLIMYNDGIVFIRKFVKYNQLTNEKHAKGSAKIALEYHDSPLYVSFYEDIKTYCDRYVNVFANPAASLSIPYQNPIFDNAEGISKDTKKEKNTEKEKDTEKGIDEVESANEKISFEEFYSLYPKKKGKADAEKAWKKIDSSLYCTILEKLKLAITSADWTKDAGKYIPYPAKWLTGKRWEDEMEQRQVGQYDNLW